QLGDPAGRPYSKLETKGGHLGPPLHLEASSKLETRNSKLKYVALSQQKTTEYEILRFAPDDNVSGNKPRPLDRSRECFASLGPAGGVYELVRVRAPNYKKYGENRRQELD
ncbi:MAG: hypothetical protein ACLP7A_05795, partial [Desulfobaccales bacterium]